LIGGRLREDVFELHGEALVPSEFQCRLVVAFADGQRAQLLGVLGTGDCKEFDKGAYPENSIMIDSLKTASPRI
jgi:hypothetical protein